MAESGESQPIELVVSPINADSNPQEKISYQTVNTLIKKIYSDPQTTRSTALDILAIYLKGQKILYTESKTFCEHRLNALMLPSILASIVATITGPQVKDLTYGTLVISVLNGFNTLLLALVSYLKLDARAEAHKASAYKFDKLQSYCEFKSGKILFLNDEKDQVVDIIDKIETQVAEIKEMNQFVLPESIRYNFRETYGQNVFASVKEIQTEETLLINRLKTKMNELITLYNGGVRDAEKIGDIEKEQAAILRDIILIRDRYLNIDQQFEREISEQIRRNRRTWCNPLRWFTI